LTWCGAHRGWPNHLSIVKVSLGACEEANPTYLNTAAIVCYLKQLEPTLLGENIQGGSPGINSIFDELLERVNRSHDDLTSRNFVYYIWIERLQVSVSSGP
jgi:hypothetical protein